MAHRSIADTDDTRDGHCCSFETTRYLHHDPKSPEWLVFGRHFNLLVDRFGSIASVRSERRVALHFNVRAEHHRALHDLIDT